MLVLRQSFLAFILLLSSCVSLASDDVKRSEKCYGDLGCFPTTGVWISLGRPINIAPQSPSTINVRFMLYTRQNRANGSFETLNANDFQSLRNSFFSPAKKTQIVVHGFLHSGFAPWMTEMKDELLKNGDYNVINVDWSSGSSFPYTQATANTRVVGAEIAKLIKTLQVQVNASAQNFHCIGHSLGSHICGYAGERTPNLGRISGLDPAGPYFENTDPVVRLDPTDAIFVDVMHTDAENFIHLPRLGLGTDQACGHVDYWPNSGKDQTGCDKDPLTMLQQATFDLYNGAKAIIACNHLRAPEYYIESINSACPFEGYQCPDYQSFEKGLCLPCSPGQCGYMGFHADKMIPAFGKQNMNFYLDTGDRKPYCRYHYQIKVTFGRISSASEQKGKLYINLRGSNGQLSTADVPLTKDFIGCYATMADPDYTARMDILIGNTLRSIPLEQHSFINVQPGQTYGFMLKSTHDIGTLSSIDFRWEHDSHWYNPLTWSILSHPALFIESVDVVNGETQFKNKFCDFNTRIDQDTVRTINQLCNSP